MATPNLADTSTTKRLAAIVVSTCVLAAACSGDHRVSPWGERGVIPLSAFIEAPNLDAHVATLEREAAAESFVFTAAFGVRAADGTRYEIRGLAKTNPLDGPSHATRVASPFGIVLALGPSRAPHAPIQLVPSLETGSGTAIELPFDLDANGELDLAVTARSGHITIYSLAPHGATAVPVDMADPVTGARLVNKNQYGLISTLSLDASTAPISPVLERIAVLEHGRYVTTAPEARAWHSSEARRRRSAEPLASDTSRLARVIEIAFHESLAERDPSQAFAEAEQQAPRDSLALPFRRALAQARTLVEPPAQ